MDKRDFIKTGLIGVVGLTTIPAFARNSFKSRGSVVNLPRLAYEFENFDNFLSYNNLTEHYSIFLNAANKLKSSLSNNVIKIDRVRDILISPSNFDAETVQNAGTYLNHRIFFKTLTANGVSLPKNELHSVINNNFGSFGNFKSQFEELANESNGSGWVWLINRNNNLAIVSTDKNNNPFSSSLSHENRGYPLFGIDMWEHSYYLDYENNSKDYIKNFWNYIDWEFVSKRYEKSKNFKI